MLLGNNLPIFGGGEYPAISLKLRDMKEPINVLTGINQEILIPDWLITSHVT